MWGTWITLIVKRAPPQKNYISPGGCEFKKIRGVFSIMRTKLVLANFDGVGGHVVETGLTVQNTVYVVRCCVRVF